LRTVQDACRRRKQLLIFNPDVPLIQRLQLSQPLTQVRGVRRLQTVLCEPTLHEHADGCVMLVGLIMVVLEAIYQRHRCQRGCVAAFPKSREQALFFIGRVLGRGDREVLQGRLERAAMSWRERSARKVGVNDNQNT
jgi:hypothetical protein